MLEASEQHQSDHQVGPTRVAASADVEVPSRRQYLDLKALHPDAVLLYRLGDFYEAFDEDAETVARDARITLTSRSFGRSGRVRMAGIPHHALNHYLGRLLAAGHTVAVAEQVSEPGHGLVERAVTRVLTPGTIAEPALLTSTENRYLASVASVGDRIGLAWIDVSTGEFTIAEYAGTLAGTHLADELARLGPAEILQPDIGAHPLDAAGHMTRLEHWHFKPARAAHTLREHFGVQALAVFGCAELDAAVGAAGAIVAYLGRTNASLLRTVTTIRTHRPGNVVGIDASTRRNLELTRGLRSGSGRGSLLSILDATRTAMGARALRSLVGQPLQNLEEIERRQAVVAALVADTSVRHALGTSLVRLGDLERLMSRVGQGLATTRDFWTLQLALARLPSIREHLRDSHAVPLSALAQSIDPCLTLVETLAKALREDSDGTIGFCQNFWPPLDQIVDGSRETRQWIAGLEARERARTGIRSLRVAYNKVFGYYIEVTRSNLGLAPSDYVRKQTVAIGERFYTAELKEAEARLLAADETQANEQRAALAALTVAVSAHIAGVQSVARTLAHLDALLALAEVACHQRWVRPIVDAGEVIEIVAGRHPVVEAHANGEPFIPNDCLLGGHGPRLMLVTGPNMGGKSTYLRQAALIVLLAQVGSFVPADAARIGVVDRIFSRVGAQDDLAGGASTFMVEMVETAAILHQATQKSLIILDEVGRGTSTGDGLAIAQAVLEDVHDRVGVRGLFATHFLELTRLAGWNIPVQPPAMDPFAASSSTSCPLVNLANVHVAAIETTTNVIFLHAVQPGPASRALGIQVARLAGLPPAVADRAQQLVIECGTEPCDGTSDRHTVVALSDGASQYQASGRPRQLPLAGFPTVPEPATALASTLRELDLLSLTPGQAVDWLLTQQQRLRSST